MIRVLRYLVKKFYTLCAILLIGLAVLVQCGRSFSPLVSEYSLEISDYLSQKLNADVSIGAIDANWDGLKPVVNVRDIRITSHAQEPILTLNSARLRLDLISSLLNLRFVWGGINVHQAKLEFEQTPEGFWQLPGLRFQTRDNQEAAQLDALFDMLLLSNHIEFHQTHLDFTFLDRHRISLDSPSVRLENKGSFHRLSLQVDVEERMNAVTLVMEGRGDPRNPKRFSARGYLQLDEFPTSEPLAAAGALLLPGIDDWRWRSDGSLDARLWFSTREQGEGFNLSGSLGLQTLSLPVLGRRLELASFTTQVKGHWLHKGGWQLALQDIQADVNETRIEDLNISASAPDLQGPVLLQSDVLDLQRWTRILDDAGAFGEGHLQEVLLTLDPQGELRNLQVTVPLDEPENWQLQANAHQVGVSAWRGVPALRQVDGFIQADQRGGFVNIDSQQGFSMHYIPTYTDPMAFEAVRGQVAWALRREQNQIYVNSGELTFRNGQEEVVGHMWLAIPWRVAGDLDLYLQIGARHLEAGLYRKYTPAVVPQTLLSWLNQSIGEHNNGMVNEVGFIYRGTLNTPNHMARSHQLYLDIDNAELNYQPGWPPLRGLRGRLLVSDNNVDASVSEGRIYSSYLQPTHVQSRPQPDGEGSLLRVKGAVSGIASDGLRALREGQLRQYIGDAMDRWDISGEMLAHLDIAVPLGGSGAGAYQRVDVDLEAPELNMPDYELGLEMVRGRITYSSRGGLSSRDLTGRLFGEPVRVRLDNINSATDRKTLIDVNGRVKHQRLAEWSKRPELLFLDGTIPYDVRVELIHRPANTESEELEADAPPPADDPAEDRLLAKVLVRSNLDGVAVDLPTPYGKAPEPQRALAVDLHIHQQTMLVDVQYAMPSADAAAPEDGASVPEHGVQALFKIKREGNHLLNANIALARPAALSATSRFLLNGYLPEFNLEQWQSVQERYLRYTDQIVPKTAVVPDPEASDGIGKDAPAALPPVQPDPTHIAGLPFLADITLGRHDIGPLSLEKLAVQIQPQPDAWHLQFGNPTLAGQVRLPEDKNLPLTIELKYLHLARTMLGDSAEELRSIEAEFDPRSLPKADISIAELHFDNSNYGSWSVQLRPDELGTLFDNIRGNIRGITVSGLPVASDGAKAGDAGAKLFWHKGDGGSRTRFVGLLSAGDIAEVMRQWDKPDIIESTSARYEVDLSWPGSPHHVELKRLKGQVNLLMENGRFKRNPSVGSDGFLRLVGLVNFDTLARRLRMDFSDLYKSGLAYDELRGSVTFDTGKLIFTEPLQMSSPSSRLQMAGSINLEDETIDSRLIATLPVAGNLTFLAALATGLPAAAGVYVVSKIFKKQVDQATSISYRIRGSWDDPEMKFDRLFESESSLRNSVNESGETLPETAPADPADTKSGQPDQPEAVNAVNDEEAAEPESEPEQP